MTKILITGGSGLIGNELSNYLSGKNFELAILSRNPPTDKLNYYRWNIETGFLQKGSLTNVDYIIHLAGSGIADKRWSKQRKKNIIESRVKSAEILFNEISRLKIKPKAFISASAIGYYGAVTSEKIYTETDKPGKDFQAEVCKIWESTAQQFSDIGLRTIQLRFGVVLSPLSGALRKMMIPTNFGIGSALGTGEQYISWIHIADACRIIEMCIKRREIQGTYNIVSPSSITYAEFASSLSKVLKKPFFFPNVPSIVLKLIFGEMSRIILEGSRVSSQKIKDAGYEFQFSDINEALKDLLI